MAGRFPQNKPFQRCFSPLTVFKNGIKYVVPCGRCEACRLDKANDWSMRLSDEIDSCPFPIFFTLTYNNKYLPRIRQVFDGNVYRLILSPDNVRFDGVKDVPRFDDIEEIISGRWIDIPKIQNFGRSDEFSFSSRRDVQLWLKNIRKDINLHFDNLDENGKIRDKQKTAIRYFIISEYGPTTFRHHIHGIIFAFDYEVAEYLLRTSLYQNWQMCDKTLFDQYAHYCDGGASGYVTQYINSFANLPQVLRYAHFKPFRFCSKNPSIGFYRFSPSEIYEALFAGNGEYIKTIANVERTFLFPYPSKYMFRLFPKCQRFSLLSYSGLRSVYGKLYRYVVVRRYKYNTVCDFLRKTLQPIDYTATRKCYDFCVTYNCPPDVYLYLLDMYYYKVAMASLKKWYTWQSEHMDDIPLVLSSYVNLSELSDLYFQSKNTMRMALDLFFSSFGIDVLDYVCKNRNKYVVADDVKDKFRLEVSDIISGMTKMSKFNELTGNCPHIV